MEYYLEYLTSNDLYSQVDDNYQLIIEEYNLGCITDKEYDILMSKYD